MTIRQIDDELHRIGNLICNGKDLEAAFRIGMLRGHLADALGSAPDDLPGEDASATPSGSAADSK